MAKISNMIDGLSGKTEEELRIKEQFSFLQKMARAKSETFENDLKLMLSSGQKDSSLEIVGNKAFEYQHGEHINISNECDSTIMEVIDEFFKGKSGVKEGFCKLVKHGLSGIIGDTTIGETQSKMFFVYPENYSIVRVDVLAYKYTFSTKNIFSQEVDNIFVYTMAKSIVDHSKVGVDYLMHTVVDMMRTDSEEDPDLSEVLSFIKELISCWQLLDSVSVSPSVVLSNAASPISTPTYMLSQAVQQEAKNIATQTNQVTASDVLQAVNSYEA